MDVVQLNQKQLAARWRRSEACLERWRSEGIGPQFLKLCGRVLYRQVDIEPTLRLKRRWATDKTARSRHWMEGTCAAPGRQCRADPGGRLGTGC